MKEYHKIQTVFKRNMTNGYKSLLMEEYSRPEFEYLKDTRWVFTEKVDGTNIRVIVGDGKVSFGGRTDNAQIPKCLLDRLHEIFDPQVGSLNESFPIGGCLYGEGFGPRIQQHGDKYGTRVGFVLFDVKVGDWWLERENVEDVAIKTGLEVVPVIGEGTISEMVELARSGITSKWGDFNAEGIVARPKVELRTRNNSRIVTKLKTRDFIRG